MNAPSPERWERQPGEQARAFAAFTHYRDSGPGRSLRSTRDATGTAWHTLPDWSRQWSWVARAEWWDAEADRHRQRAYLAALIDAQAERLARTREVVALAADARARLDLGDLSAAEIRQWQLTADRLTADTFGLTGGTPPRMVPEPSGGRITSTEAIARLRLAAAQASAAADAAEARLTDPIPDAEHAMRRVASA